MLKRHDFIPGERGTFLGPGVSKVSSLVPELPASSDQQILGTLGTPNLLSRMDFFGALKD